jgi:hypothetical protein
MKIKNWARWCYSLPSVLTIGLVIFLCLTYFVKFEEFDWLSSEVSFLSNNQFPKSYPDESKLNFNKSIDASGSLSYNSVAVLFLAACLTSLAIGLYVNKRIPTTRWWCEGEALLVWSFLFGLVFHFIQVPPSLGSCGGVGVWVLLVCRRNLSQGAITLHLWLDMAGISMATFFALTTSRLLRCKSETTYDANQSGSSSTLLKKQTSLLCMMLYIGSFVLIVSTLRLRTILNWSLEFLQPYPGAESKELPFILNGLKSYISNLTTLMGLFYTLILAAIFVPAALILKKRAGDQAGLVTPLSEQLLRLAAMVGPLLAGPIGEIVGRIK